MMRKHYTRTFKAQVVRELLKEEKTLAQLAAEYSVHPTQLVKWRATAQLRREGREVNRTAV
jgi:putative transposase